MNTNLNSFTTSDIEYLLILAYFVIISMFIFVNTPGVANLLLFHNSRYPGEVLHKYNVLIFFVLFIHRFLKYSSSPTSDFFIAQHRGTVKLSLNAHPTIVNLTRIPI